MLPNIQVHENHQSDTKLTEKSKTNFIKLKKKKTVLWYDIAKVEKFKNSASISSSLFSSMLGDIDVKLIKKRPCPLCGEIQIWIFKSIITLVHI